MTDVHVEQLQRYRDDIRKFSPPWLQRGLAESILYSFGVHADALADALVAGVAQRFPGAYSFESLPLLGRERRIERGIYETDAAFAQRLTLWLLAHQKRGGPYALLGQLYYHYQPEAFDIDLIYANGRMFRLNAGMPLDQAVTRYNTSFRPEDGDTARWARWWLVYHTDRWADTPPTETEIADLRLVPHAWNAAHAQGTIVIMSTGAEFWNSPEGSTWNEPGTWNSNAPLYIQVDP